MRWQNVPEVGIGSWKSLFADGGEVEHWYSKLVAGSRPESLPGWHDHVTNLGEV